jgi:hypothetical protein
MVQVVIEASAVVSEGRRLHHVTQPRDQEGLT